MNGDNWGKRQGAPSRRVKKNMQLTQGFVSPTLKQDFDAFKKRGSKNPSSGSEVDAAHRTSDHRVRKNFIAFRAEIDAHEQKKGGRTHAEFKADVKDFIHSIWDKTQQTKSQVEKVKMARKAFISAHSEQRRLTYAEAAKIGNAIKTLANESLKNIGPGESHENRSIGARPDQRFMRSPGGKHAINTPISREQRRFHEKLSINYSLPQSPSLDYRTKPSSSSMPKLPLPVFQSPPPQKPPTKGGKKG